MSFHRAFFCIAALSLAPLALNAQTKPDPVRTSLISALDRIHLYDKGATWHITIHAKLVDQGNPGDAGTINLYRTADGNLRTVFAFPKFNQTRYVGKQTFITGDAGDPPAGLENFIHFFNTTDHLDQIQTAKLHSFPIKFRAVHFNCTRATDPNTGNGPTFCSVAGSSPTLRYNTIGGSFVTLLVQMTTFEGGDAPTQATVFFQYQPIARLTLEYAPLSPSDSKIHRPADATLVSNVSQELNTLLNQKLVEPFVHRTPTQIAPADNGAVLFRLELSNSHIQNMNVLAASDETTVKDVIARIQRSLSKETLPAGHIFVNYPYVLYVLGNNNDLNESMADVLPADQ